ncbi:MAG TPA: glycosyltransferase family 39 protein [Thermoanaerobaculia bacterium]|nr:glycosyltransferase family 39 protein [Thermoanaerobaculia bacterium]
MLRVWTIIAAISIALLLGSAPLFDADEGRNGEVGREMAATNDYVVPHLDGLPYVDKPIVYFAAEAAAMEILGPTELAARLPAYLFTLATAIVVFWFARKLWGVDEACVAVIAFLSMPLTIAFARTVIFDSALTFFIVLAIVGFYFAVEEDGIRDSGFGIRGAVVAWLSMGLGVLTKGPIALALPLLVAIPYAIWRKRFRALWSIWGLVVFIAVIAPWVAAMQRAIPDFLQYVLVTETAQRLTTGALKRTGPPWYFIPYLIGGALPWSIALFKKPTTENREPRTENREPTTENREPTTVFLWLWILVPLLFFSLSQSKRPQYILPLMPAIALLVAREVRFRAAAIVMAVFGAAVAAAPLFPQLTRKMDPVIAGPAKDAAIVLGVLLLTGGLVAAFVRKREMAIIALSLPMLMIPLVTTPLMKAIGERRSTKSLVAKITPLVTPRMQVVGVDAFTGSMAFYLRRPITVASDDGEEFTSNYIIRHYGVFSGAPSSTLKPTTWLTDTIGAERVYIVRDRDTASRAIFESRGFQPAASGAHYVVYVNRIEALGVRRSDVRP